MKMRKKVARISAKAKVKARIRKRDTRLRVEHQEIIAEVQVKSFETVRLSRLKYLENEHNFIDMRLFRRGSDSKGDDIYYPTTRGVQFREDLFVKLVDAHFINGVEKRIRQ
jgi:hypothetical protein